LLLSLSAGELMAVLRSGPRSSRPGPEIPIGHYFVAKTRNHAIFKNGGGSSHPRQRPEKEKVWVKSSYAIETFCAQPETRARILYLNRS